jgi:hypothetical protein
MESERLRESLKALHNELASTESVDEKGRELLRVLMDDIQKLLDKKGAEESCQRTSLVERLAQGIDYFEELHPTLALTMKQVIETLSNMGI